MLSRLLWVAGVVALLNLPSGGGGVVTEWFTSSLFSGIVICVIDRSGEVWTLSRITQQPTWHGRSLVRMNLSSFCHGFLSVFLSNVYCRGSPVVA